MIFGAAAKRPEECTCRMFHPLIYGDNNRIMPDYTCTVHEVDIECAVHGVQEVRKQEARRQEVEKWVDELGARERVKVHRGLLRFLAIDRVVPLGRLESKRDLERLLEKYEDFLAHRDYFLSYLTEGE